MIKVIELFGGIGAPHKALTNLGINFELVDMIEIDAKAVKSYNAIHNTNFEPQDITTWNKEIKVDYLHASTPCQAFSVAGKGIGAEDNRGSVLWEHTIRIIKLTKPSLITLENVKGLLSLKHKPLLDWYLNELDLLGYRTQFKVLNAKYYNIPQNRERVFFISRNDGRPISFPDNDEVTKCVKDILMEDAIWSKLKIEHLKLTTSTTFPEIIYIRNGLSQYHGKTIEIDMYTLLNQNSQGINIVAKLKKLLYEDLDLYLNPDYGILGALRSSDEQKVMKLKNIPFNEDSNFTGITGITGTLTAANPDFKHKIINQSGFIIMYRKLLPIETFKLMGFSEEDFHKANKVSSNPQLTKQAGNSIVVNVIQSIIEKNL